MSVELAMYLGSALLWILAQEMRHSRELAERDQRIQHLGHICNRLMEKANLS